MVISDFKLEVFFGEHEFTAPYLLAQSDCESMTVKELLEYEPGAEVGLINSWLGYTEVPGSPELRETISKLYRTIEAGDIIVHSGAQEPIFNFANVLLSKGDHIICQFPIYQSLYEVANAIGCNVSRWEIKQSDNGWAIDFEELERLINPSTKLICLNSPNNPTGYTLTEEEIKRIADIAQKYNLYVFCDEVYKGVEFDGISRPWFADVYQKGVSLGVMSKAYGLAGLRIGWVATKDKEIQSKLIKMKHYTSICSSSTSELLATIALKHSDTILERNRKIIRKNLDAADTFFSKYPQIFKNNKPMAGPIAFHKMNLDIPIDQFCNQMIKEKGILLLPATVFDYKGQYFRMGYGRSKFIDNLKIFEEYLLEKII